MRSRLYLLDAYALIYRAYYALIRAPRRDSQGRDTGAIFGFVNTLQDLLDKQQPDLLAVVFDPPGGTFRHKEYPAYKAQREETPEGIRFAVPFIKQLLEAYQITAIEVPNYEADDVIGTLAKQAEVAGYDVRMVTPDKDFGQLVSDYIRMLRPAKSGGGFELWGAEEVTTHLGLNDPKQVIDYLGLMGDSSDNIPGCRGIGAKTASKLLTQWGSMERIYDHIDEIKGAMAQKLRDGREEAFLSRRLATICIDAPIAFNPEQLKRKPANKAALAQIFNELEFRALGNRILGEGGSTDTSAKSRRGQSPDIFDDDPEFSSPQPIADLFGKTEDLFANEMDLSVADIHQSPHQYICVSEEVDRLKLFRTLAEQSTFAFDTETDNIDPFKAQLVGLSVSYKEGEAYYLPMPEGSDAIQRILAPFAELMARDNILKVGQNIKYDLQVLRNYGIRVERPYFDTMIAHYLLQPDARHSMDHLSEVYLQYKPIPYTKMIGQADQTGNIRTVPIEILSDYAAEDADITLRLYHVFAPQIAELGFQDLMTNVEMPLVSVLANMEREGVRLDTNVLSQIAREIVSRINQLEAQIHQEAGENFNINSPKQVGDILFGKLKVADKPKKTKTGIYSTGEEILQKLRFKHPIVSLILDYRTARKLLNTYIEPLPTLLHSDGRLHTSFNQAVAGTGRLSSSDPNLQNIPIRTPEGRSIRRAFVPRSEEYVFLSADYSQIELRLMAHLSGDEALIEAFRKGEDIHTATAAKIYGLPPKDVSTDMRRKAKTANFGIIYGISAFGLSERLNISRSEAADLISGYFDHYPCVKVYMDKSIAHARKDGYVTTLLGRKRFLPDINSRNATVRGYAERNAINAPIQGSAADIIKMAMIQIDQEIRQRALKSRMILQVHDELNFDAFIPEVDELRTIVRQGMEGAIRDLAVPLVAEIGVGNSWLEAH